MQTQPNGTVLGSFRVLDITDDKGMMCGKMMAMMGAEVIKIEPSKGDAARNLPPFYKDVRNLEHSLFYFAYNSNKKSITLNIETSDGQELFKRLVKLSHFVIESFEPGYLDNLGLGYSDLSKINPRIILTSITPFGQDGPFSKFKSSDLMCSAMSGLMYLVGDPDRAPLRISVPQSYLMGASEGLVGTMIAHYYRERTGEGQHVDVAIRDPMIKTTISALPTAENAGKILRRGGSYWVIRGTPNRMLWPCKDGWVTFRLHGGTFATSTNTQLIKWMDSENAASDYLKNMDWANLDMERASDEIYSEVENCVGKFFKSHTKKELFEGAKSRDIMLLPVSDIGEVTSNQHLAFREYWDKTEHPDLGITLNYPGPFIRSSETPLLKTARAPRVGEHNAEIYRDILDIPDDELEILKAAKAI